MDHISLSASGSADSMLEFSHFIIEAQKGYWNKKDRNIVNNIKVNVIVEGNFIFYSDGRPHRPVYGDVFILSPRQIHSAHVTDPIHLDYYQFDIGLGAFNAVPSGKDIIEKLLSSASQSSTVIHPGDADRENVLKLCRRIENDISENELALAYAGMIEFIAFLNRLCLRSEQMTGSTFSLRTAQAIRYIESHYSEQIQLSDIAAEAGVSISYISRIFKRETGLGLHQYINRYRIAKSLTLLERHTVTETAYLCGFCDSAHFISVFSKFIDTTPMKYKNSRSG